MTVSKSTALRFALTGALGAALLAGASGGTAALTSAKSVEAAQAALARGKVDKAIEIAERAVAATPRDVALRTMLAQAYLKAGRFESAATTFEDAIELGDANPRNVLGLALAHAGCGRNQDAVAVLDEHRQGIPAEDLGLALALAGETGRGVAVITDALRASQATPKLRQNLAYAYALDGRWNEARLMVAQDLPADKIDSRITDWAKQGKPDDYQLRVASLLGVPTVRDVGQPQYLALGDSAPALAVAAAEPAPVSAPVEAAAEPVPVDRPVAAAPVEVSVATVFAAAFAQPTFISRPVIQATPIRIELTPSRAPATRAQPAPPIAAKAAGTRPGSYRVQLGAFVTADGANRAVAAFAARNPSLRGRLSVSTAMVNGRNYWRVAATGYDAGSAHTTCSSLKARGNACFAYVAPARGAGGYLALARR